MVRSSGHNSYQLWMHSHFDCLKLKDMFKNRLLLFHHSSTTYIRQSPRFNYEDWSINSKISLKLDAEWNFGNMLKYQLGTFWRREVLMMSELIPWHHIYDVTVNALRQEMADDVVHEQHTVIKFYVKLGKNMPEIKEDLQKFTGTLVSQRVVFTSGFIDSVTVESLWKMTPVQPKSNSRYGQKNCCNRRIYY